MRRRAYLLLLLLLVLTGCQTFKSTIGTLREDFMEASNRYNELFRWQQLEMACDQYLAKPLQSDFRQRLPELRQIKVIDYRLIPGEFDGKAGTANLYVEISYHRLPSMSLQSVQQKQDWRYTNSEGWRLQTLPPTFP